MQGTDLEIRPLSPAIGVDVRGIDLSQPLDDDTFARIERAWEENCVALAKGPLPAAVMDEIERVVAREPEGEPRER